MKNRVSKAVVGCGRLALFSLREGSFKKRVNVMLVVGLVLTLPTTTGCETIKAKAKEMLSSLRPTTEEETAQAKAFTTGFTAIVATVPDVMPTGQFTTLAKRKYPGIEFKNVASTEARFTYKDKKYKAYWDGKVEYEYVETNQGRKPVVRDRFIISITKVVELVPPKEEAKK